MIVEANNFWWEDSSCLATEVHDNTVAVICQYSNSCPSGWQEFENHCYMVPNVGRYWTEAEKDCNNKGGHLASIHSAAEHNFIHSLAPSNLLWIGGTDAAVEVGLQYKYIHIQV
jgi:hypothetical protein